MPKNCQSHLGTILVLIATTQTRHPRGLVVLEGRLDEAHPRQQLLVVRREMVQINFGHLADRAFFQMGQHFNWRVRCNVFDVWIAGLGYAFDFCADVILREGIDNLQ